ncbi:LysR family transcriptional regulator [Bordetella holmesii]|uniref:LysR substrate-binding domain protein n=2 Tax=Bordetella holmesii TaxID=35814 RepID=A0A158M8U8_9BORD|nr:LysR family transcriptional regulator [Bordetella holmesii]AHV93173.1 bacterial regulatory helix-turn-helix, lysR family protein [Bordetella holmesii ATCC 51541]AIT25024.1 bacterial regulatory helix-turn-helix, lysR family protein [Bordetella holmesii 44057]EWM45590.1 bacterial regulatory helix-turn-helix, lysR family protein [Bordetella holmesii 70147]EWM48320.1 bacterial regulatory helix-turn-helix, lysR family protein [Bordetella holmesii 41130]EWM49711.1 bacterial regulatory helix-turn-
MEPNTVQLNDIALFVEVAKRKSFSLAARALHIPTSTLSRRIGQLERAIGLRLINRNTRRLELTDSGSTYLRRCQGLIDEARLAQEQLLSLSSKPKGRLSISMPYSLAIWLLPTSLRAFMDAYPDLECEFDLSMKSTADSQGEPFDIVLRFGRAGSDFQDDNAVVVDEIIRLDNYLYASDEYLEQHGEPQSPADLIHHQCLRTAIDDAHSFWLLTHGKQTERIEISGHLAGNNISVMGTFAGLGLGITRLPSCQALDPIIERHSLRRILPQWQVQPISIYGHFPQQILPAKTRAFMDFIQPQLGPADTLPVQTQQKPPADEMDIDGSAQAGVMPSGSKRRNRAHTPDSSSH